MYFNIGRVTHCINAFIRPNRCSHVKKFNFANCCTPRSTVFFRGVASVPEKKEQDTPTIYEKFGQVRHIYKFPFIAQCSWIVNLKWYILPVILVLSVGLEEAATEGAVDSSGTDLFMISLALIIVKCNLLGIPFSNFVSHVFVTPQEEVVLSYLSFIGSREDEKFPKNDLYLQSRETGPLKFFRKDSFYMLIRSRSTKNVFRINFKHCDMFDEDLFRNTIGEIPESAVA